MRSLFLLCLALCLATGLRAQSETDSLDLELPKERATEISPQVKAALLSAVLPGAGQAYNRKYWKIPLVYAGVAGFGYAIRFNHDRFVLFRNGLAISTDGDSNTNNEGVLANLDNNSLRRLRDEYRRNRDLSIILSIAFYGLNIVDAVVDAHLKDFDVSEDLSSIQVSPTLLSVPGRSAQEMVFGLSLTARI